MPSSARAGRSRFGHHQRAISWGFLDQAISSATNLGLSILAGRLLGPTGLGKVFLGFSVYLIVVNLVRRLLSEPLVSVTSALDPEQRAETAASGLTICLTLGLLCTAGLLVMSATVLRGFADRGLLLVAPWLLPTVIQDYWRSVLFREKRASAAAANDGVWLIVMLVTVPAVWLWPSDWVVMAWWGLGACAAAIYGFLQTRTLPTGLGAAWTWFRKEALPFGKWNAGAGIVINVGRQLAAFVVAGILGMAALGGLRAADTLFAPISLIAPAIGLPGLPAMARALARGEGRKLAIDLALLALVASVAWFLMLLLGGGKLLPLLFGASFAPYRRLMWPVAIGQMFAATQIGFLLLLKAQQRGRFLLLTQALTTLLGLALVAVFSSRYGLMGAAWSAPVIALLLTVLLAFAALRRDPTAVLANTGGHAEFETPSRTSEPQAGSEDT